MKYIKGSDRHQIALIPNSLEDLVDEYNEVRIIDLFVDSLDLESMSFRLDYTENGRPAYHPSDLLKLYLYGYLNRIRSSRCLEKECKRNLEVMWLLRSLTPDHNTIANFRKDNKKALSNVFKATVQIAKNFHLIGGKLIAGDSTKIRAQNSKKNNFNEKKIERHLEYIDHNLDKYNQQLANADGDSKKGIQQKVDRYKDRKVNYQNLSNELDQTGEKQISTSDPDSRNIMIRNHISEVAYSIQTTVDAKHNIPIDYKLSNQNDSKAMGYMLERAVGIIGNNSFTALYDKGYHTGSELKRAQDLGIKSIVAIPDKSKVKGVPNAAYNSSEFIYNYENDSYSCPQGQVLKSSGTWHKMKSGAKVKHYRTKACRNCSVKEYCTKAKMGRLLSRSEYYDQYKINENLVKQNKDLYKKRQAIVEHPYGTIKRQWGFDYIITKKGMSRASADVGLIFIAYNLRRLISIIGLSLFKKYLKGTCFCFSRFIFSLNFFWTHLRSYLSKRNYSNLNFQTS